MDVRKGEHVFHLHHGVGKIKSIGNYSYSGQAEAIYVQLYFKREELTLTVLEKDLPEVVRGLISSEEAQRLLGQVAAWNGKPEAKWKARAHAHQAAIDSGDPFEYVKVLKGLSHLESNGHLRSCDREHLSKSFYLLTEELACALKKSPQRVNRLLTRAIEASP